MTEAKRGLAVAAAVATTIVATSAFTGFASADSGSVHDYGHSTAARSDTMSPTKQIALYTTMRKLWADHMFWTYATVDAFFNEPKQLDARLARLLDNQRQIGAAIAPFYGKAASKQLTNLLLVHIKSAVPVLTAAKAGDKAALDKSEAAWYANADDIADFLAAANPKSWPKSTTRPALEHHITQTTAYAVDLLKGNYKKSIMDFEHAYNHMMMLADVLAGGIVAQFPAKF